ncbi:MAG: ATP-binding protein [Lachnospiraceae bacterium]|nr:ATP-binding protein [Lachnospiraceae bacterium]
MIQNILKLSEIQNHRTDLSKTTVSAKDCFGEILDEYRELCECMDITFYMPESIDRLPHLMTNKESVREIMKVLLDNAVKFVPEGGSIWVEASPASGHAVFCVRDNGPGIPKEQHQLVFERFFKSAEETNQGGSGLGLAIARELADGLGEKIWVESEAGMGAAFFFTIHFSWT